MDRKKLLLWLCKKDVHVLFEKSFGYRKARLAFNDATEHMISRYSIVGNFLYELLPEKVRHINHNVVSLCIAYHGAEYFFLVMFADHEIFIGGEEDLIEGIY